MMRAVVTDMEAGRLEVRQVPLPAAPKKGELFVKCLACGICTECWSCVFACERNAIIHDNVEKNQEINIGAVVLAHKAATMRGDTKLAQRADRVLRHLRRQQRAPRDGWFDRLTEWDAVR